MKYFVFILVINFFCHFSAFSMEEQMEVESIERDTSTLADIDQDILCCATYWKNCNTRANSSDSIAFSRSKNNLCNAIHNIVIQQNSALQSFDISTCTHCSYINPDNKSIKEMQVIRLNNDAAMIRFRIYNNTLYNSKNNIASQDDVLIETIVSKYNFRLEYIL